jgi:DNA-binding response OmpR family regulator
MVKKGNRATILIIEDEDDIRTFASRVLELEGYRVLQASDGDEGLKLARGNQVALVLLVLSQMKSDPELSSIPVVVFTASAGVPQQSRALAGGAADYLVKPLSATSLREPIARILRQKRKH